MKSGRLDRGWRRRAAHAVRTTLRKQIVPHPEMRNLARWSGEPKRSLRARPRADICATRTPPVRGRRRRHISLPPHRQRHLHCTSARRVPARRRRRTASTPRRSSACGVGVIVRRRVAAWGKTAPACARLLVMGALHTYYRRRARTRPAALSNTLSARVALPPRFPPFTVFALHDPQSHGPRDEHLCGQLLEALRP